MALYVVLNLIILLLLSLVFSSLSILIVGIIGMLLVTYLTFKTKLKFGGVLSIIFTISIIAVLIAYWGYIQEYGIPYYSGGSDDLDFEIYSQYIVDRGYILPSQYLKDPILGFHNSKGFLWLISWIMRLVEPFGGYHTIAFRVFNVNLLIALGVLITSFFKENYGFSNHKNSVVLIASTLFPNALYISIHVFRDTLIILLLFSIFYLWDRFLKKEKKAIYLTFKTIIITLILTYFAYWVRSQNLIFIIGTILLSVFMNKRTLSMKNFGVIVMSLFILVFLAEVSGVFQIIMDFNERYTAHKLEISDGLSSIIFRMALFPFGIIIRFIYGLISPIPIPVLDSMNMFSDIKTFFNVLVSYGTLVQISLLPYLFKNIKRIDKVVLVFFFFMLGIVITTFTFRHFILVYPFMIILIFREFYLTKPSEKLLIFLSVSGSVTLMASVYLLIK